MRNLVIVSNRGPFGFSGKLLEEARQCIETGRPPQSPPFGEGGLVQAMSALLKAGGWDPIWIGASMGDKDMDVANGHYSDLFRKMREEGYAPSRFPHIEILPDNRIKFRYGDYDFYMRSVFFDTEHMHSYYNQFSNGFLWPLMHLTREPVFYKVKKEFPRPTFKKNDFLQYMSSGVTFSNTVFDETRKNKKLWRQGNEFVVWIQDYHLMQVADNYKALLVESGFDEDALRNIRVGQFMHTPFFNIHDIQGLIREDRRNRLKAQRYDPFPESIESVLKRVTWGMLANDFIGFHTKEYCDNYLSALQEWFPVEIRQTTHFYEIFHSNGVTTIGPFPIGLDVDRILRETSEDSPLEHLLDGKELAEQLAEDRRRGCYLFGGLERCDYTKGLLERLDIFQHALERLRGEEANGLGKDARFYQVTSPSRLANPAYRYLHQLLSAEIDSKNRELRRDFDPIVHLDQGVPPPQNYRLMKQMDAMLVTPLEDGMNLVAFEYILSQKSKRPEERGLLVLSQCGAARLLKRKGFGEKDGVLYINFNKEREAGARTARALNGGARISQELVRFVERECRVDAWAEKNIEAIVQCRKEP